MLPDEYCKMAGVEDRMWNYRALYRHVARGARTGTLPFPLAVLRCNIVPHGKPASDVRLYPAPLKFMFTFMMALEQGWFSAGGRLFLGRSALVACCKSDHA